MTDVVSFQNPGLIDPRCITTVGVSVKESANPIGYFGTGLKYAIAIILRAGGEITIWRGTEPLRFTCKPVEIRGKPAQIVCMNGQELGFTTELGKNWQMWQALRELYCNAADEDGTAEAGILQPDPSATTVHVRCQEFAECYRQRDRYFIATPVRYATNACNFHAGAGGLFYRGVRVAETMHGRAFRFAPNIHAALQLTEDRTPASPYEVHRIIGGAILACDDAAFLREWLTVGKEHAEFYIDLNWAVIASEVFVRTVTRLYEERCPTLSPSAVMFVKTQLPTPSPKATELLPVEQQALRQAIDFCRALKYNVDEYTITVVESLGDGVMGTAVRGDRQIFISKLAFQKGDMTLAGTLLEEWAHIKHGVDDCSRSMQDWLLDNLMRVGKAYLFETQRQAA